MRTLRSKKNIEAEKESQETTESQLEAEEVNQQDEVEADGEKEVGQEETVEEENVIEIMNENKEESRVGENEVQNDQQKIESPEDIQRQEEWRNMTNVDKNEINLRLLKQFEEDPTQLDEFYTRKVEIFIKFRQEKEERKLVQKKALENPESLTEEEKVIFDRIKHLKYTRKLREANKKKTIRKKKAAIASQTLAYNLAVQNAAIQKALEQSQAKAKAKESVPTKTFEPIDDSELENVFMEAKQEMSEVQLRRALLLMRLKDQKLESDFNKELVQKFKDDPSQLSKKEIWRAKELLHKTNPKLNRRPPKFKKMGRRVKKFGNISMSFRNTTEAAASNENGESNNETPQQPTAEVKQEAQGQSAPLPAPSNDVAVKSETDS
eukprot:Awhi_evm1s8848